jgi:hypothetical protein
MLISFTHYPRTHVYGGLGASRFVGTSTTLLDSYSLQPAVTCTLSDMLSVYSEVEYCIVAWSRQVRKPLLCGLAKGR